MLELEDVHVHYGKVEALKGVSFAVRQGEVATLIGGNGAGKTTTLRTISGLRPVTQGRVRFEGRDITGMAPHRIVELGLCQAPEGRGIFPGMTVMENLEMGAYARTGRNRDVGPDLERVFGLFPRLAERRRQLAGTLSGGEQQMVAMARALMSRPKLMLMDEPSMGLAPILVERSFEIIKQVHEAGVAVLVVEQNANVSLSIADRGYVLQTGRVVLADSAENLLENEGLRKAYLGR